MPACNGYLYEAPEAASPRARRTIHKSQGMTLDQVVVHLEGCFAEGQVRACPCLPRRNRWSAGGLCEHFPPSTGEHLAGSPHMCVTR